MQVESGVPVPSITRAGRSSKYPWKEMDEGDFFFVACNEENKLKRQSSIGASARNYASNGEKFVTRYTEYQGEMGIGVWRVA